jgi:tetratricopeptide (TPR) repeat protein
MANKLSYRVETENIAEEVKKNYHNGNFHTEVELYQHLLKRKNEKEIDLSSQAYYALSLVQLDLVEDAIRTIEEILQDEISITCEVAPLFYELGELLIDQGEYELAQKTFRKLVSYYQIEEKWYEKVKEKSEFFQTSRDNLIARNKLDQAFDLYDKSGDFFEALQLCREAEKNCSDPDCQEKVQASLNQLINRAAADIEEKLRKIDEKIAESKFLEAQEMLSTLKKSFSGEIYPLPIREKIALIHEKEEFLLKKEVEWKDKILLQKLEKANSLLESENYEEAIALFDQLKESPYQVEAETKKQLAIDRLARKMRIKAGQFFLQARGSGDPELKKIYLIESYNILKEIIDNYPNNSYAKKIRKNLTDVRSEIEKVYPEFFKQKEPLENESLSGFFEDEESFSLEEEP